MLPKTASLLQRAINISMGVSDAGLCSAFGVTIRGGFHEVDRHSAGSRKSICNPDLSEAL
jgi:hypothetical protein